MLKQQWRVVTLSALASLLWLLPMTLGPWIFGKAVDDAILGGSVTALWGWTGVMVVVVVIGGVFGVVFHTLIVRTWLISLYGTTEMVTRKVAQMGHVLPRRSPTGEVLSVASSDADEFGALTEIIARAAAQLVSYLAVAAIVLSISTQLGLVVLAAAPLLLGAALPLLRPLHRRQQVERSRNSDLTSMATDIVAGLRILRGIGGEQTFGRNYARQSQLAKQAGVSSGIWQAAVEAVGVLLSGVFLVSLVWLGSRQVTAGALSVGQLVSFLGYGLFMVGPIRTLFELAQKTTRALVSARRAIAIFEQRPPWRERPHPRALDGAGELVDDASGFVARPGRLTVVVSAVPEQSAALADRLGRYLAADVEPVAEPNAEHGHGWAARRARAERARRRARIAERDEELAGRDWGVRLGGVDLGRRPPGRRTQPDPGQRHRQPALRGHAAGRDRPPRPRDPRPGRARLAGGQRRGRLRRAAGGVAGSARGAGPRAVRRPAPAGGPGAGPGRRSAGARARGTDVRRGRAH